MNLENRQITSSCPKLSNGFLLKVLMMTYQTYSILRAFVHVLCSAWNTFSADIRRPHSLSSFTSLLNVSFSVRPSLTTYTLYPGIPHAPFLLYFFSLAHFTSLHTIHFIYFYLFIIGFISIEHCVYLFTAGFTRV